MSLKWAHDHDYLGMVTLNEQQTQWTKFLKIHRYLLSMCIVLVFANNQKSTNCNQRCADQAIISVRHCPVAEGQVSQTQKTFEVKWSPFEVLINFASVRTLHMQWNSTLQFHGAGVRSHSYVLTYSC